MIEKVLLQTNHDGEFTSTALFSAALGFEAKGRTVLRMTAEEIEGRIPRPEDLVFGGVEVVRPYLEKLECAPKPLDYPDSLREFLGRSFEVGVLGTIRRRYNKPGPPVFIKPLEHKLFTGHVVQQFRDLIGTAVFPSKTPIYCVEPVEFLSEWRFYCEGGLVVGVGHYKGEPLRMPDPEVVSRAASKFAEVGKAPAAYGLDFGVCAEGQTRLVEVNDMIALGNYGLNPLLYTRLIELRWDQIIKERVEPPAQRMEL